jgi:23S rRNA pseudouridine1911/1915/1917 synthase
MQKKIIYEEFKRQRIDFYLSLMYNDYSRSYFQKLIDKFKILVNNKNIIASYKLKYSDVITINFEEKKELKIMPEKIKLNVVYEDDDIIVVNKQAYIVMYPCYGHLSGTLFNALMWYAKGKYNPYLIHRLDKDTSGIVIFAKNEKTKINILKQFKNRSIKKIYLTAVNGNIVENKGRIEAPLGRSHQNRKIMSVNSLARKKAITEFSVIRRKRNCTLLKIRIITGRTHQIRSHMKYINHPVIGDKQYGGPHIIDGQQYNRQVLHSYSVVFTHPSTSKTIEFFAELPTDIKRMFNK